MNKKFAIVMALFMALAGCTESIEEEISDLIVIPGCNDDTAVNFDENATNSDACLTELALEQAIMDFMTTVEQGPTDANSSMGITVTSTSSDGMSASTEVVVTPNGMAMFTSMSGEMDMGGVMMPLSFMSEQTIIPNPDGTDTTVIHVVHMDETQEFTMDNAVPWSVMVAEMMADDDDHDDDMDMDGDHDGEDHGDDDMDMDGDMGLSTPESPDGEDILEGFDIANSTYAMSLSTTSGYSFSASMEETYYDEDGNESSMTTTFTFVLDSTFKVTSISATNDMESMTVTLLSDSEIAGYFGSDWSSLATEALPFAVMPMGGDDDHGDHGDDDDHGDHGDDDDHGDHGDDDDHGDHGDDDDHGDHDDHHDGPTFICGDGTEIPFEYVNDNDADCDDGADEQQYDTDGDEINWFDCMDGSQVWISQVNDGTEDCPDGDDEAPDDHDDHAHGDHDDHGDDHSTIYDGCTVSTDPHDDYYECWMNGWLDEDGDIMMSDGYEMDECEELSDSTWECESHDNDMPSEEDMFEMGDLNDDGFINMSEMEHLFSEDHDDHDDDEEPPTPEEAMENDTDNSGGISWSEFYDAWEASNAEDVADGEDNMSMVDDPVLESELHQAFNDSDVDGDGELNLTELQTFIDELEHMYGSHDDDHDERTFHCSSTVGGTPDTEIPFSQVNDGTEDCGDGSDEPQDFDSDGTIDNWFDCMDGSNVSMELVNDGTDDCPDGDDESHDHDDDHDDGSDMSGIMMYFNASDADGDGVLSAEEFTSFYNSLNTDGPPTVDVFFSMIDADNDGLITVSEYGSWTNDSGSDGSEPMSEEDWNNFETMFDYMDTNSDGAWDLDEFSSWYENSMGDDDDDHDGHGDGGHDDDDDHDGHDHGDHDGHMHGPLDWLIVEVDSTSVPPIAGDLSNYYAVLSKCTMSDDGDDSGDMMMGMGGAPEMDCGPDIMFTPLSSAGMGSAIMFHDADSSGTLTYGDMVHVSENATSEEWTHVRLYSTTADAYSDENPMMTPGFTGVIGMIALLGAALLTRRD